MQTFRALVQPLLREKLICEREEKEMLFIMATTFCLQCQINVHFLHPFSKISPNPHLYVMRTLMKLVAFLVFSGYVFSACLQLHYMSMSYMFCTVHITAWRFSDFTSGNINPYFIFIRGIKFNFWQFFVFICNSNVKSKKIIRKRKTLVH